MERSTRRTPGVRDLALRRLRGLTVGMAGLAAGAVALFAGVGAATIPGRSTTAAAQTSASQTSASQISPTTSPTVQSSTSSTPHTISGGS